MAKSGGMTPRDLTRFRSVPNTPLLTPTLSSPARGGEGEKLVAAFVPPPPSGGRGDRGRWGTATPNEESSQES